MRPEITGSEADAVCDDSRKNRFQVGDHGAGMAVPLEFGIYADRIHGAYTSAAAASELADLDSPFLDIIPIIITALRAARKGDEEKLVPYPLWHHSKPSQNAATFDPRSGR